MIYGIIASGDHNDPTSKQKSVELILWIESIF